MGLGHKNLGGEALVCQRNHHIFYSGIPQADLKEKFGPFWPCNVTVIVDELMTFFPYNVFRPPIALRRAKRGAGAPDG